MTTRVRTFGPARWGVALLVASVMAWSSPALSAAASGDFPISFDQPQSKTVEYGEQWFFEVSGTVNADCYCASKFVLLDAKSSGTIASVTEKLYLNNADFTTSVYPFAYKIGKLDAGNYSFLLRLEQQAGQQATTDNPVNLTIAPAKLATQLRVEADPNSPANVVMTVLTTGRFVQEIDYSESGYSAPMPAGTWKITAKDPAGEVAFSEEFAQKEGTQSSFSTYWAAPPAGTTFQFDGEFTPDAAMASNFSIEPATSISLATPKADEEAIVVPVDGEEPAEPVAAASVNPSLPVWAVWALGLLIAALAAATTVLAIRLRHPREVSA